MNDKKLWDNVREVERARAKAFADEKQKKLDECKIRRGLIREGVMDSLTLELKILKGIEV